VCAPALFLAAVLVAHAQEAPPAGTVNYSEGQVTADGATVETRDGRAELLLTPGIYFRAGEHSTVRMEGVSPGGVKVELVSGEALVEVDQVDPTRRVDVIDKGADARLDHPGIYLFKAGDAAIAVYRGKLRVEDDRREIALRAGEELRLDVAAPKPRKFDRTAAAPLYAWSEQRAGAASAASEWTGEGLLGLNGQESYTAGWYWSPWYKSWAFIPKKGRVLTPFGYGLYAPQAPHYLTPVFADFRK
jgi:hypothetical protein